MSTPIKIESNVPLVEVNSIFEKDCPWPIGKLKVGQSFAIPHIEIPSLAYIWHYISREKRRHPGRMYATRQVLEDGERKQRIWRLEDGYGAQLKRGVSANLKQNIPSKDEVKEAPRIKKAFDKLNKPLTKPKLKIS